MSLKANKRVFKRILAIVLGIVITLSVVIISLNILVVSSAADEVITFDRAVSMGDFDCIIVLGAHVYSDGSLSDVLRKRVDMGANLYFAGASDRILVSGDHGSDEYDEPDAMKDFLISKGIDQSVIFTDHAGFSTYESMYRAKEVFCAERVLIVTNEFHISRAVYIARVLGLDAYGVPCENTSSLRNTLREGIARACYVAYAIFKPKPTHLGEAIPISGDASAYDGRR